MTWMNLDEKPRNMLLKIMTFKIYTVGYGFSPHILFFNRENLNMTPSLF